MLWKAVSMNSCWLKLMIKSRALFTLRKALETPSNGWNINLIIWQKHNKITYFSLSIEILCGFWLFKVSKWLSGICSKLLWFSRLFKGTIELFLFNYNLTDWSEWIYPDKFSLAKILRTLWHVSDEETYFTRIN